MNEKTTYLTLEDAGIQVGVTRATIYVYMADLDIKTRRLGRSKKSWVTSEDVALMKEYREKPWIAEERRKAKEQSNNGETAVV